MSDALALLYDALKGESEVVPEGWKTRLQWQDDFGLKEWATKSRLRDGLRLGVFEHRTFRIWDGKRNTPIPHYRIISEEPTP